MKAQVAAHPTLMAGHQQFAHRCRQIAALRRQARAGLRQCKAELRTLVAASPAAQAAADVRFLRWLGVTPAPRRLAAPAENRRPTGSLGR